MHQDSVSGVGYCASSALSEVLIILPVPGSTGGVCDGMHDVNFVIGGNKGGCCAGVPPVIVSTSQNAEQSIFTF